MNANRTFWIGKDHTVCEDYALAGIEKGVAYAIVSDGCSSSTDVDIGARVLTLAAKEQIISGAPLRKALNIKLNPLGVGENIIRHAAMIMNNFPSINPQVLDATLLIAWVEDGCLRAYLYGDGMLIHRSKTGVNYTHINLTSNAPDYLSYLLDKNRMEAYNALPDNKKRVCTNLYGTFNARPFEPFNCQYKVEEGDIISVISDGINSFSKSDSTPIDWRDLIDEFTAYKNFEGEFVLRRLSAFKRKCLSEGITHSDDISVASIVV